MIRRNSFFLALPLLLLASACVSVSASRLGTGARYPEVPKGQVLVFDTEADVPGDFEKVALLYVSGDANTISHRQMIEAARKKAGRLGANAIILSEFRDPKFGTRVASVIFDVPVERRTQMIAIRIHEADEADDEEHDHQHDGK